eukprot:CAMPEP_0174818390 /NCGR_PEP_ID=MMETSP1107-20130205/1056_1 /TAXON_ID=36770 /ORGANISM="Paraphysomonas vestita, Strain GFlagA" /LENGTH=404 /DNA_ID=CAMNT_0016030159 /DNA_START=256 /DNA_END=1470 /DNA_ORIENTATION=-
MLFLVIIPEITQHMVDESELVIIEANIINPNDVSFTSKVTQKFKDIGDADGTLQMHKLSLYWNDGTGNKKLATLTHSNSIDIGTGKVTLSSQANVKDVDALSEFNLFAITANEFNWKIKGSATVETAGLSIPVDVDKTIAMKGFNNFPNPPIINQINITGGTTTEITNIIDATFINDANIAITFGQEVIFTLKSEGITIGTGYIDDLELKTGTFRIKAVVLLSAPEDDQYTQLMKVISNFTSGYPSYVTMGPFKTATTIAWLEAGLNSMSLPTSIPGLTQKLINNVDMYPVDGDVNIPFTMSMSNPIDTSYSLTHIKANIYSNNILIATVNTDVQIVIPARETLTSPTIIAVANLSQEALQEIARLETVGSGLLDVISTLTGQINEFGTESVYKQYQVPATLHH